MLPLADGCAPDSGRTCCCTHLCAAAEAHHHCNPDYVQQQLTEQGVQHLNVHDTEGATVHNMS
jgi:hypothetical protein